MRKTWQWIGVLGLALGLFRGTPAVAADAAHSGLPLLLSNRVGNLPEALEEGVNGWAFDPVSPAAVRQAVVKAFSTAPEQLREMGEKSCVRADRFWNTPRAVQNFLIRPIHGQRKATISAAGKRPFGPTDTRSKTALVRSATGTRRSNFPGKMTNIQTSSQVFLHLRIL
jgi:hypothetical protein